MSTNTQEFTEKLQAESDAGSTHAQVARNEAALKVILLGDSAVGKSKLVERFLLQDFKPQQMSTFALTLYTVRQHTLPDGTQCDVNIWDTAGQERFESLHPSYFHRAHAAILAFDITRKVTYKSLERWYSELRTYCPHCPAICIANKIDVDYRVTQKSFNFPKKYQLPFYFVSASDGTNAVKVFEEAIRLAYEYYKSPAKEDDFIKAVSDLLGEGEEELHEFDDENN